MQLPEIHTIDGVIQTLENIILDCEHNNNPLGYFAALYQKVTIKVKQGIENNFFDDGKRMEQLDIVFAQRYLDAYFAWQRNEALTGSWRRAFEASTFYWPIVLQHLLLGINAHINLDLGIAAAEVSAGKNMEDLKNDFDKINKILSDLVGEVQKNLTMIWPALKKILQKTKKVDDFLVDFSMELARDGAWKFALALSDIQNDQRTSFINARDQKVAQKANIITNPGWIAQIIFAIIRLGERGSVTEKIGKLRSL